MIEFVRFYLKSGKFLEKYPYLIALLLIPYVVRFLVESILNLRTILKKRSKLFKLVQIRKNADVKDQKLINITVQQIEDELFEDCTGYCSDTKNKLILDFYLSHRDKYTWREVKLIFSKFEIRYGYLKLKPLTFLTWIEEAFIYAYYGFMGLSSFLVTSVLLTLKDKLLLLAIPVSTVFVISVWMILRETDKVRIYRKMIKEPGLKDENRNSSDIEK